MVNLAIFGSGRGSNAEKIIERFQSSTKIRVALIASNKEDAGILELSKKHDIPSHLITDSESLIEKLSERKIEYIALAGYLKKISPELVKAFPDRMFNIHPSLLPKYGGKGMYGLNVHKKVIENGDKNSGITIHYVNENYD
ncbi:MAG: phosphoribosylglycinamide formyltransferase, partial [Flavobacteriales bacterium]|nr:phosphoribosylglycinamide formyltransferase [Flavobacteriales bacterium]